jgi:SAM-dependent methyltransferase
MSGLNDSPNREQAAYWNEQGGPRWVARQLELDAELEPFGVATMSRLELRPGKRVLDIGCGSGATSLMLAERVRPGEVVGLDISETMLARARERGKNVENLRFECADAQTFAFSDAAYDAVFSRFGLTFFSDPSAAFVNLRRALRPGGKLGFVCWRAARENPSFTVPLQAALPFLPEPPKPPDLNAPGPFAFADQNTIAGILARAGYGDIAITPHDGQLIYGGGPDIEGAVDLALQIGPLGRALSAPSEMTLAKVRAAVRDAFVPYHGPSGVAFSAAMWLVTARRQS